MQNLPGQIPAAEEPLEDVLAAVGCTAADQHVAVKAGRTDARPTEPTGGKSTWDSRKWLANTDVLEVVKKALDGPATEQLVDQFERYRQLADDEAQVSKLLAEAEGGSLQGLTGVIMKHLKELKAQAFATAHEQNTKFIKDSDGMLGYGSREEYDGGLNQLIGNPNDLNPLDEMFREHNEYRYATEIAINSSNYGISTTMAHEWKGAAGVWTPRKRNFALDPQFKLPAETRGLGDTATGWAPRVSVCAYAFFELDSRCEFDNAANHRRWWEQHEDLRRRLVAFEKSAEGAEAAVELTQEERVIVEAQRAVRRAGLLEAEVVAVRLWSGPAYDQYNAVLRGGVKGRFVTTLHALCSAAFKLARISAQQVVYRGIAGRAIAGRDFQRGSFVERGAMSFTTNREVAVTYTSFKTGDHARYVLEVQEGEVDKGADISSLSYYPHEKEKLYGPLCMMQIAADKIQGNLLVLQMRLNVNTKAGTLEDIIGRRKGMLINQAEMLYRETSVDKQVKRAGAGSRRDELMKLRESFECQPPSAFNDLALFGDANADLLRTLQGVGNFSRLAPQLDDVLKGGDAAMAEAIADKERRLKLLRTALLKRWLRPRLRDLQLYRALRLQQVGWVAFKAAALVLWLLLLLLQLLTWALRLALDSAITLSCARPIGHALQLASTRCRRQLFAAALACGPASYGVLVPLGVLALGVLGGLRGAVACFTVFPLQFTVQRVEEVRRALKQHAMHAMWAVVEGAGSESGLLREAREPWLRLFGQELARDCEALEDAAASLQAELETEEDQYSSEELQQRIREAERELERDWQAGGLAAKDALGARGARVSARVREAVARLSTRQMASRLRRRRLQSALRCLEEACQTLPLSSFDTSPMLTYQQLQVARKWGASFAEEAVSESGRQGRSVLRVLQLFEYGTGLQRDPETSRPESAQVISTGLQGRDPETSRPESAQVINSSLYNLWEARVLGSVSVVQEYLDAINLEQLAEGHLHDALLLSTITATQAAMLVNFIGENALGDVVFQIGESRIPVRLEPRREIGTAAEPRAEDANDAAEAVEEEATAAGETADDDGASTQQRERTRGSEGGGGRKPWGSLLGLDVRIGGGGRPDSLWLRPPCGVDKWGLTVEVLRVLAEAAEYHYGPKRGAVELPRIRHVDAYYNSEIGRYDGGREAVPLLLRVLACVAPEVERLHLVYCMLGRPALDHLARALPTLPALRELWLTFNPDATMHTRPLRRTWEALGRPYPARLAPDLQSAHGVFIDWAGDVGLGFLLMLLRSALCRADTAQPQPADEAC